MPELDELHPRSDPGQFLRRSRAVGRPARPRQRIGSGIGSGPDPFICCEAAARSPVSTFGSARDKVVGVGMEPFVELHVRVRWTGLQAS